MLSLLPEFSLTAAALYFFFKNLGLFKFESRKMAIFFGIVGVVFSIIAMSYNGTFFSGAYRADSFSRLFTLFICFSYLIACIIFTRLKECASDRIDEFFFFTSMGALGLVMAVSSVELMSMFIAIEISSYPLYIITTFRKGLGRQFEASFKYIIFGAVSTALMLYGISYIFGLCGSTFISDIAVVLPGKLHNPMAALGMLLFMAGLLYKLAAFPFHFWAPDVYSGAAAEVTTFIAALPKLAATALLLRIVSLFAGIEVIPFVIGILAVLSMTIGNLLALSQNTLKRLLAYSAISHAGFILIGLVGMEEGGGQAVIFYGSIYAIMSLAAFMVAVEISGTKGDDIPLESLKGLWKRSPVLALMLAITLSSLAGLPPTAGFSGKLFLLVSAWKAGFEWVVIAGVLNTLIAIYYYLKVIKISLVSEEENLNDNDIPIYLKATSLALASFMIILGLFPQGLLWLVNSALGAITL